MSVWAFLNGRTIEKGFYKHVATCSAFISAGDFTSTMSIQRLHSLDGLRGAAALAVAIFHFSSGSSLNDIAFTVNGWLSVDIFFVISGVVLDRRYFSNPNTDFVEYFAARIGRMMPLYFMMFSLFLAMDIGLAMMGGGSVSSLIWPAIVNIFALQSFGLLDKLWFYGPSWSVSAEIWVNLVLFPLVYLARRSSLLIAITAVSSVIFITRLNIDSSYDYGWLRCLFGISLGILVSRYAGQLPTKILSKTAQPTALLGGEQILPVILSLLWFTVLYATYAITALHSVAPLIFGGLVLALMTRLVPLANWLFSTTPLTYLGKISFAIYMTHFLIGGRVMRLLIPFVDSRTDIDLVGHSNNKKWGGLELGANELQGGIFLALYLVLVIGFAHYTLKWIEAPLYDKFKPWTYRLVKKFGST